MGTAVRVSATNCAIGFSHDNVTGANHSRSFGITERTRRFRNQNCLSSRRLSKTSNRPGQVNRFWNKVLFHLGYLSKPEPFQRQVNQGLILGEDNQKMSKSRENIVNPDAVIDQYGADAFRCYEMFMGPLEQMKPWSMKAVEGVSRFLARVGRLFMNENQAG